MTKGRDNTGEQGTNPDLATMHYDLVALGSRLEASSDTTITATVISAASDQVVEVNARITAARRVLLAAQTQEIAMRARAVSSAITNLEREIEIARGSSKL